MLRLKLCLGLYIIVPGRPHLAVRINNGGVLMVMNVVLDDNAKIPI